MATYNILDPEVRRDPYAFYRRLRDECPVAQVDPFGYYLVTRHEDVIDVLKRTDDFSSTAMSDVVLPPIPNMPPPPPTVISSDNPTHNRLRKVLQFDFTPRQIGHLQAPVESLSDRLMSDIGDAEEFDFVRKYAVPLPVIVIAKLIGIEEDRLEDFKFWSDCLVTSASTMDEDVQAETREGMLQMMQYFSVLIERRRAEPAEDIISKLVLAETKAQALDAREILSYLGLLLVAGNETTTNLIGGTIVTFQDNPEQLAKLQADPSLLNNAVEELVRYLSPVQGLFRRVVRDTKIGDITVPKDAILMATYASANRDERRWEDPDRFDIERNTAGHIGFGWGLHFCLGANLARREGRVALERWLPELPTLERMDDEVEYVDSWFIRGPKSLRLRRTA